VLDGLCSERAAIVRRKKAFLRGRVTPFLGGWGAKKRIYALTSLLPAHKLYHLTMSIALMGKKLEIDIPYFPRDLQSEIHASLRENGIRIRFACLAIHRRFGKSVFAINECIDGALTCPLPNARFFYVAPTMKQARSIVWDYLKEFTRGIPDMRFYETDLRAEFPNGARIQLSGAENFETLRGNYVDGVVLDEWGNMSPQIWREVLRPALADRKGWVIFLGTPNGKNHFYDSYKEAEATEGWLARTYSALDTKLIDAEELEAARKTMGEEEFRQEFLCDWSAAVRGGYYGAEMSRLKMEGRVLNIPHARQLPVDISMDLGMDDATSVWFTQSVGNELRCLAYHEWTNTSLLDIMDEMRRMPFDQYRYGKAFLPHDAEVRSLNDGKTRTEMLENSHMFEEVIVTPRIPVADGINAVRQLMPQIYMDRIKCSRGIDCLDNYRKQHDPKTGIFKDTPVHDKFSNGADSFRYLAINHHPEMGDTMERARISKCRNTDTRYKPRVIKTSASHARY